MERFILIDTSTALCSTALVEDGQVTCTRTAQRDHAAHTAPFVKEMLDERGLTLRDCCAVGVGKGPGSFTGLRVGASTAKGLCFGAGIPLIAVGSLDTLVWQARDRGLLPEGCTAIVLTEIEPKIIETGSYDALLAEGPVLFIGDGAEKCREVLAHPNAHFAGCYPEAASMLHPALQAWQERKFEDVAYFEPFYLKDFVATVSKKRLF